MITPDGEQIYSQPLELSYFDGTNTVVLAELTNSIGVLVGNNQVVYPNAFAGLKADMRYTYTKAGFEQDVILQQQPLTPESYGLNPATARLQIVTEFFNSPNPTAATATLPVQAGITLVDQNIGFGTMQMGLGRAFLLGQSAAEPGAQVAKSWLAVDGRQFLVEEVPVNAIVDGLETLPLTALNGSPGSAAHLASRRVVVPRHKPEKTSGAAVRFTKGRLPATGFVMDYQTINSSQTNYTFQSDTTYYISGAVNLFNTNTFEGGTVIKYATNGSITISGSAQSIIWTGGEYRPVVFTAVDDNSVGVSIGSGTPSGYYGNPMLSLGSSLPTPTLTGMRFCYAQTAIQDLFVDANIYDAQFVDCQNGLTIGGAALFVGNALFANTLTNVIFASDGNASANMQNCTLSGSTYLATAPASPQGVTLALTNCIVANVTNILAGMFLSTNGDYNGSYSSGSCSGLGFVASASQNPFQSVGSGDYYLTNGCGFVNAGTTNIDPGLLADIGIKTTYPPIILTSGFKSSTTLYPQAQRDMDTPDLGYHYDPLDYCWTALWCGVYGYSGTLFLTNGVAIGLYGASGFTGNLTSQGTALQPNQFVRYSTVQEQPAVWGATMSGSLLGNGTLFLRFTDVSFLADASAARYLLGSSSVSSVVMRDCQFQTVYISYNQAAAAGISLTNNVFRRSYVYLGESDPLGSTDPGFYFPINMYNNLLLLGTMQFYMNDYHGSHYTWNISDNLFVQSSDSFTFGPPAGATISNNGYYQASILGDGESNYKTLTNIDFQVGPLGPYYYPTNGGNLSLLLNTGTGTASSLGLYHYTVTTNEIPEGTNVVSIGYHYVATDTNGVPLDTNGDGIPDYIEDANGNGLVDSGEIGWNLTNDLGLQVIIVRPRNGSSLP